MRYISLFSGIEAASVAWEPLGWEPLAFCEIDEFPSAVLAHRFPDVENLGDITKVDWKEVIARHGRPDVVVGGSPCQSFSVAGKREGLDGASGLMFEYIRAVSEIMPKYWVWENVPGALSSSGGADFECFLREMAGIRGAGGERYGIGWRVLDAQFFGVAQRRRRLFAVGVLGDLGGPAEILFESEGLRWDNPSSREKREALASDARSGPAGADGRRGGAVAFAQNTRDEVRVQGDGTISGALAAQPGMKQTTYVAALQSDGSTSINSHGNGYQEDGSAYTLNCIDRQSVAYESGWDLAECLTPLDVQGKRVHGDDDVYSIPSAAIGAPNSGTNARMAVEGMAPTLNADGKTHAVVEPVVMASAHTNAEIGEGGGNADPDGAQPEGCARTSNGDDVFPALCATDGDKQFIDNQSVRGGRLVLDPRWEGLR